MEFAPSLSIGLEQDKSFIYEQGNQKKKPLLGNLIPLEFPKIEYCNFHMSIENVGKVPCKITEITTLISKEKITFQNLLQAKSNPKNKCDVASKQYF